MKVIREPGMKVKREPACCCNKLRFKKSPPEWVADEWFHYVWRDQIMAHRSEIIDVWNLLDAMQAEVCHTVELGDILYALREMGAKEVGKFVFDAEWYWVWSMRYHKQWKQAHWKEIYQTIIMTGPPLYFQGENDSV